MNQLTEYINLSNQAIDWVAKNKPEQFDQRFLDIVEQRRILKQIQNALLDNPSIAAYGISQVGKSYLMSNLLQDKGKPFIVKSDGGEYDFINEMNPRTQKTEATGVVTRFSSFKSCPERYKEEHPIMMRTLSVSDIATMLSDGYYNDVHDYTSPKESEIEDFIDNIRDKYSGKTNTDKHTFISADDILNIKEYFNRYINNAQTFKKSCFFDKLALVAENIPVHDFPNILSILWNNERNLTSLFERFVTLLSIIDFERYIYLPAEALLHHENNENTIMSVQCLKGLNDNNGKRTHVYICNNEGGFTKIDNILKSELCGICAEIVLKIPEEFLDSSDSYDLEMISDEQIIRKLGDNQIKKEILKDTDLLDLPGARARLSLLSNTLSSSEVLTNVLLRGKVAYLFNMYCETHMINIMMYCHHNEKHDVSNIPLLLNNWVNKYIGDSPETRAKKIEELNGISPLFYIATMFNIDMSYDVNSDNANRNIGLASRWEARFNKVLIGECFGNSMDWYKNWLAPDSLFQNSYLLRDFKYSVQGKSNLYEGFADTGKENKWVIPPNSHTPTEQLDKKAKEYYNNLRESFINNEYVKRLFEDPAFSWDVAATQNNDGALYIIQRLSEISSLMCNFRKNRFDEAIKSAIGTVYLAIKDFHVSPNKEEKLRENIRKAKRIHREMDIACNTDNYFFGHLLQNLQLRENEVLNLTHSLIHGNKLNNEVHTFSEYEIISTSCDNFKGCINDEEKWQKLINTYAFNDKLDAENYLEKRSIDYNALFHRTFERKKNSFKIASEILEFWENKIQSVYTLKQFTNAGQFDPIVMGYLITQIITTAKELDLESRLATLITEYVDIVKIDSMNESLIADILAETINEFVNDLGFKYLDDETITKAENLAKSDSMTLRYIRQDNAENVSEDYITSLFNGISSNPAPLTPSFEKKYFRWKEFIVIAFISHLSYQEYDRNANEQLSIIMEGLK